MRKVESKELRAFAQEIKFEKEKTRALKLSVAEWEQRCRELEASLDDDGDESGETGQGPADSADDSEWKIRY